MIQVYYRISDGSYNKPKLPGTNKEFCLNNFTKIFNHAMINIVADNCEESYHLVKSFNKKHRTNLGNAGSLIYSIENAINNYLDDEIIYFVEDDYLHLNNSINILKEGINISDYVTLYDHPDKYTKIYNNGEVSKVVKTENSHWRYTISTCMTFASTVKILKEDIDIWKKYTDGFHPHDHDIFTELNSKNRKLAVCIPGYAVHTDLTFSGWANKVKIDNWAIDLLCKELESNLNPNDTEINSCILRDTSGWERLKRLDAIRSIK